MAATLRITQQRSVNGANPKQRDTLRTLLGACSDELTSIAADVNDRGALAPNG